MVFSRRTGGRARARIVVRMTFTGYLRARGDDELVALLRARPDLASPSPSTLASLAVRATSRASLQRALAGVDAGVLQALEAVHALAGGPEPRGVSAPQVADAVAGDDPAGRAAVHAALVTARSLALLHPEDDGLHLTPGVAEQLGPYPAGLAPAPLRPGGDGEVGLDGLPEDARAVLDALTWDGPVGARPDASTAAGRVVDGLLERGLLEPAADPGHVLLPRGVALRLRGGRTHRGAALAPVLDAPVRREVTVVAEGASGGERAVRLVVHLARTWEQGGPGVLRSGGLGVRDLRRTAGELEVDEPLAAFVVELAAAADLVADDGEEQPRFVPTVGFDEWGSADLPGRWAALATTWLTTDRAPWLVGERDERGALRVALDPEGSRPWAPRLRRSVLEVLAALPAGTAPDAGQVRDVLAWRTPRSVPPEAAVAAVLREAGWLGVTGAGALTPAGRALLDGDPTSAFAAELPPTVDELLLQGDLTGIVPGRPSAALESLIDASARVESRGGALTVRFTPDSVRAALDAGTTADALLAALAQHAPTGVPQPLEYLVRDAARRHGRLRAGTATSYLRADDPALLAGLADDPRLAALGLLQLAPTVLAAQAPVGDVLEALRTRGLSPVAETPGGEVLHLAATVHRAGRRRRRRATAARASGGPDLAALVARMRGAGDAPAAVEPEPHEPPAPLVLREPADAIAALRQAAAERSTVWVELVGPDGRPQRRRVRPVRVDAGRVRVLDLDREAELTVAVHRISSVAPLA